MRPTKAVINLQALTHNLQQIRKVLDPNIYITAVVKANAYGHGAVQVSQTALAAGASALAVALPEEGIELREHGITAPILVLGLPLAEQAHLFAEYNLIATICTQKHIEDLAQAAKTTLQPVYVMIKIDTGMGRIGLPPEQVREFAEIIVKNPYLRLDGLFTHMATADSEDKSFAVLQLERFQSSVTAVTTAGIHLPFLSAGNSAGIMDLPSSHYNTVRPGIILYGLNPSHEMQHQLDLQPVLSLRTKIAYIKRVAANTSIGYGRTYVADQPTYIATLPIGYADGYNRLLSNRASVLIGGKRRPIRGNICMDQIMVDLGPECDAAIGDEAVLIGRQGEEEITADELASICNTINYELLCTISSRVPRVYIS